MTARHQPLPPSQLTWPWRESCHLRLQAGGMRFLPAIRTAMQSARRSIAIELYLAASGALFDEWLRVLGERAAAGVRVRVLLDAIGCDELRSEDWQRLDMAGIEVRRFNPLQWRHPLSALVRDHRKLVLVDGERAWVGGFCLNDESDPRIAGDQAWFDGMVACRGPVVDDFTELFEQSWALAPEEAEAWITAQGLAARVEWAMRVPRKLCDDLPDPRHLLETALADTASEPLKWAVPRAESRREGVAILLASADFNRR